MKLTIVIDNSPLDEIKGDLSFEGDGSEAEMISLVMAAGDLLQDEWMRSGLQEFYSFREALADAKKARK